MSKHNIVSLDDMLEQLGEDKTRSILSSFLCPLNPDVEFFIRKKAIEFSKQSLARTFLVFSSFKKEQVPVGYFALANKEITFSDKRVKNVSKTAIKRMKKFAYRDGIRGCNVIVSPLIAQLSKNFLNGYDQLITGNDLLYYAIEKVREAQKILGGKTVYIECEDIPELTRFYESNGFYNFGLRALDKDEVSSVGATQLIQMLKYL